MPRSTSLALLTFAAVSSLAATAQAQATAPVPAQTGTAPADLTQSVAVAPKAADAPDIAPPTDSMNAAVSAGGQYAAGNSKLFAATGLGKFDIRRGNNGFGVMLVGNYAEGATPPATSMKPTTENYQARLRYDRYFTAAFGAFAQITGTHDAFQAITFRFNADPGVKLFFYQDDATKFWGELGYDFEFDQNYVDGNDIEQAGSGGPALDPNGNPYVIEPQNTIHSTRLFAGVKHAFNKDVQLSFGLEYLQGLAGTGTGTPPVPPGNNPAGMPYTASNVDIVPISVTGARLNGDALLAASLGAGFSVGIGLSEKFNSAPLAGKQDLDSTGTVSLIYAFSSPTPAPPPCPCPEPPPPAPAPAPAAAPAPTPAPAPAPGPTI